MQLNRIYIEITNICNLKCSFCSDCMRESYSMTTQQFSQIIDQIKPHCKFIYLHVKGEPLLHPQFSQIMDILEQQEMKVQLVTNGTFIKHWFQLLNYTCLRKISFSLHSIDYQNIHVETYMKPLIEFAQKASQQGYPFCEFRFWTAGNLSEKAQCCFELLKSIHDLVATKKKNSWQWIKHVYIHFDHEFIWPCESQETTQFGTCYGARQMIGILSNGVVVPCCLDDRGEINLGNIFKTPLSTLLTSERYQNIIKGFNQHQLIEPLCQKCNYRKRFD